MTPEEAESFYEDDEDPAEVFARFSAGPHVVTGPGPGWYARGGIVAAVPSGSDAVPFPVSAGGCLAHVQWGRDYIRKVYGDGGDAQ